jgi:hypothetical protein
MDLCRELAVQILPMKDASSSSSSAFIVKVDACVDPTKRSCRFTVGNGLVPFCLVVFAEGVEPLPYNRIDKQTNEFELIRLSFFIESSPICGIYLTVMVDAGVDPTKRS